MPNTNRGHEVSPPAMLLKDIIKTEEPSSPIPEEESNDPSSNDGELLLSGGSDNGFMIADSASSSATKDALFPSLSGDDCEMMKVNEPLRIGLAKPNAASATFQHRISTPTATQRVSPRLGSPGEPFPPDLAEHRILYKIKRFLSTLVQFGMEINGETGDKVKELILNLVASTISISEFHQVLQEVTNFPLRPFVLPFLKSNVPLLIRDVTRLWSSLSNTSHGPQKSLLQYIRSQPNLIFDLQGSQSSVEINDIFNSEASLYTTNNTRKRRGSSSSSLEDNNDLLSPLKRTCSSQRRQQHWVYPQQQQWRPNDNFGLHSSNVNTNNNNTSSGPAHGNNPEADDEWKNIYVMLNCILGMVEKTKRALSILQTRNITNSNKSSHPQYCHSGGLRSNFGGFGPGSDVRGGSQGSSSGGNGVTLEALTRYHPYCNQPVGELLANTIRNTEDRVVEVRRRAEEAVNEVKRIALAELQGVVCMDERRSLDSGGLGERIKMDKLISETNLLRGKSGFFMHSPEEPKLDKEDGEGSSRPNCWNCGRNASETCSGCNLARYCSQFCQLKDWESHHRICGLKANMSGIGSKPSTIIEESSISGGGLLQDSEESRDSGKFLKSEEKQGGKSGASLNGRKRGEDIMKKNLLKN